MNLSTANVGITTKKVPSSSSSSPSRNNHSKSSIAVVDKIVEEKKEYEPCEDYPAVNDFGHASWKSCPTIVVGEINDETGIVEATNVSTYDMGLRCHDLDRGMIKVRDAVAPQEDGDDDVNEGVVLRAPDRDGRRRALQPTEVPREDDTRWPNDNDEVEEGNGGGRRLWYVPFQVMPNLDNHGELFGRWENAFLDLINTHRLPNTDPIKSLAHAHRVLPHPGTRNFGDDLKQEPQRWLADQLTSEWEGQTPTTTFLDIYADTIREVIAPFMKRHYGSSRFHVQKHPKNLRLQFPAMRSVAHWHCDRMFGHQREINFVLCLTDFTSTGAGISIEVRPRHAVPIVAGAGSLFSAPFGYKPHGNTVNSEKDHTRVSLDWRVVPGDDMLSADEVGASATSGLPYAEGEYFTLWENGTEGDWAEAPHKFHG